MAAFSPIASQPIASGPAGAAPLSASITETASAADTQSGLVAFVGAIAESGTATDAPLEFERLTETATATDTPSCALIRVGAITEASGAREEVLSAALALVASAMAEAASASDVVSLPVWSDRSDDSQTWLPRTGADNTWTTRTATDSTWTEH